MSEQIQGVQTSPRDLIVTSNPLEYGNIEAWMNIIESYHKAHNDHQVELLYEAEPVKALFSMFKMEENINRAGFQVQVFAGDGNLKDVPKLYRFLVEGGGPNYKQFLKKEVYQVLNLF